MPTDKNKGKNLSHYLDKEDLAHAIQESKNLGYVTEELGRMAHQIFKGYASKKSSNWYDIQEIVSFAYARLMKPEYLENLEASPRAFSYLTRTCNYAALDYYRKSTRNNRLVVCESQLNIDNPENQPISSKVLHGAWERACRLELSGAEAEIVGYEDCQAPTYVSTEFMGRTLFLSKESETEVWDGDQLLDIEPRCGGGWLVHFAGVLVSLDEIRKSI